MDSLLANYASDDDGDEGPKAEKDDPIPPPKPSSLPPPKSSSSSFFSSLPKPKSLSSPDPPKPPPFESDQAISIQAGKPTKDFPSSNPPKPQGPVFSSLPRPKTSSSSSSSSFFSSLPPPKSEEPAVSKKVVRFTPPLHPSLLKRKDFDDEDEEEEEKERKPIKVSSSGAPKNLSSMLPAPKNSLCLAPSVTSAASRRSTVDAKLPAVNAEVVRPEPEGTGFESYQSYDGNWVGASVEAGVEGMVDSSLASNSDPSGWIPSYGTDASAWAPDYGNYEGNWSDGSVAIGAPEIPDVTSILGKRGKNIPAAQILEVKQDELMKNRPREGQTKMTGIAFGPSYQPISSAKGKPSKLHKRKHQIGSLFFDMRQKEMELAERRSKGLLTKSETQAKYGW
ncbi:uncharacterized protein [Typha latifolia]|uniref:uncharacterized protein n=1 Tax=Typha latifolia TaxID=4733 RepID=UPI003C2F9133